MNRKRYYSGRYRPVNIAKYEGDWKAVCYRSSWERQVFKWCDSNEDVVSWSSEETVIPYRCKTDNRMHRYFVDLKVRFKCGQIYLIEIKPKKQTQEPKIRSRKTRAYLTEVLSYAKNMSKWQAAREYCADRGMIFEVWTEDTIKALGIKLLT